MTQDKQLAVQQFATEEQLMSLRAQLVNSLPQLTEQLQQIRTAAEERVSTALALEASASNLATIKKERAAINKEFGFLEQRRKLVKGIVSKPYTDFEAAYKDCVTEIYKGADQELGSRVKAMEESQKAEKRTAVHEYFDELCAAREIDFVTLDDTGINVTLSASLKSLKALVFGYIESISEALGTIDMQEHSAEILVEFKRHKSLARAIADVTRRHEAIAEEQRRAEERAAADAQRAGAIAKVEEAAQEHPEITAPPIAEAPLAPPVQSLDAEETDASQIAITTPSPMLHYKLRLTGPDGEECDIDVSASRGHMVTLRKIFQWKEIYYACI